MAKQDDVSTPSGEYRTMAPRWAMLDALLGGTDAMRAAGEAYLPRHPEESVKAYQERLQCTVLLNMTEMTLDGLVGRVFKAPVVLGEDVPAQIRDLAEDVDLCGNSLHVFAREWFRTGVAKGLGHVLVDHQRPPPRTDGRPRTLEDDRREGLRPYWQHVAPENLLAAYSEVVGGVERLVHVRIYERTVERAGWSEVEVERVRVIEPTQWQLWRRVERKTARGEEWVLEDDGPNALGVVPLVTFMAGRREGPMSCKPPLMDLAHLNVSHWQSSSDQRNILTTARFPILACSGVADGEEQGLTIGPNKWLATPDPQGKWYYVEHQGAAIEAGRRDLEALEDKMAGYGAEFLKERPGNEGVAARALDSAEAVSPLQAMAEDFKDAVERALQFTALWLRLGDDAGGSVTVSVDTTPDEPDSTTLDALHKARAGRDISREAYVSRLQAWKVLPDDYDAEADAALLEEEAAEGLGEDLYGEGRETPPSGE